MGKKMRKKESTSTELEKNTSSVTSGKKEIEAIGTPLENRLHELFCLNYTKSLNKVDSYLSARTAVGDKKTVAYQSAASRATILMQRVEIQTRINELADHTAKTLNISKYRIIEDIQNEIDTNPFDALEWTKSGGLVLKELEDIPPEVRKCIKTIKENKDGRIEISFYDKQRAREMLMKYEGMLSERIDLHVTHDLGDKLAAAHQRVIKRSGGMSSPEGIETAEFEEID